MEADPKDPNRELDSAEQDRLDSIFESARRVHHLNLLVAAVAGVLVFPGTGTATVTLSVLDVVLPKAQAVVPLYLLSIFLSAANDRLAMQGRQWSRLDPRRVPFPWHPLGRHRTNYLTLTLWILLPVLVTGIAASIALAPGGVGFLLPGALLFAMGQRGRDTYGPLLSDYRDQRGGPATLSIWLLYAYRTLRNDLIDLACVIAVFAAIPEWREQVFKVLGWGVTIFVSLFLARIAGGFGFIYRRIDRLGVRYGFPATSPHYDQPPQPLPQPPQQAALEPAVVEPAAAEAGDGSKPPREREPIRS